MAFIAFVIHHNIIDNHVPINKRVHDEDNNMLWLYAIMFSQKKVWVGGMVWVYPILIWRRVKCCPMFAHACMVCVMLCMQLVDYAMDMRVNEYVYYHRSWRHGKHIHCNLSRCNDTSNAFKTLIESNSWH